MGQPAPLLAARAQKLRPPERTRPGTVERMGPRITLSGGLLRKGLRLTHIRTEHSTTRPIYTVSPRSPNNERTNDGWRTSWIPSKNVHVDRYAAMRDGVMKTYEWTPRNARNTLLILGLIPFGLLYIGVVDSNKWDLAGKRKDESLYKYPSSDS
ncbi:hypothetical protein PtA15_12A465 [Puccinia triticina]|uniref:NADH dehydrogenase [ubiquinone] 1 beta subcomplex subunit 4 n=1 Tax=Puccinia triticina TaxID=208348 RepID=A0ABY7CZT4_9BASI|nr:uncharacterized protein PtA15_12A465 [Puccinia triticina]WAQ90475.1 hypothetical protein PtA15_12A465 [Puccinia triticina]